MTSLRKALLFGFFIWLIPFVVAFLIFPLRESSRPLFESIMPVAVTAAVVWFGVLYFKGVKQDFVREGLMIGLLWLAISLIIDLPLMLSGGPMQMTLAEYVADIGVTYLLIPVVTVGLGAVIAGARA
jgi:hypothetical protein